MIALFLTVDFLLQLKNKMDPHLGRTVWEVEPEHHPPKEKGSFR